MKAWIMMAPLLLTAGTLAAQWTLYQEASDCHAFDPSYLDWWLEQPNFESSRAEFGNAVSGIIEISPKGSRSSTDSVPPDRRFRQTAAVNITSLPGEWAITLVGVRRDSSVEVFTANLAIVPTDSAPAILIGKWRGRSPMFWGTVLYGLGSSQHFSFLTQNGLYEDSGGFHILLSDKDAFSGWWTYGPSLTPKTYGYFCATREQG